MRCLLPCLVFLGCLAAEAADLPVIHLEAKDPIKSDVRTACSARLTWPAGQGVDDPAPRSAQIKFRGASSQAYDKKSFAVKLDLATGWLGLAGNREWVLNAAFVDCSLMRHKLSYDLFRSLGTAAAPRFAAASRFVEVELNGKYHGVYLLMQPVDDLLVGFPPTAKSEAVPGVIFKAVDHAANFGQPGHEGFEQRAPDPATKEVWTPLDELNRFVSQASDHDFFDPVNGIARRLDMDNAIDFHLLVLVTSNLDGITKNYNLVRPPATPAQTEPKFSFVPWDYDATFGRNWDGTRVDAKSWLSNRLFDRLLGHAEYQARYAKRWQELRTRQLTVANVTRLIDENIAALGEATLRNERRWKRIDYAHPGELTFTRDTLEMKRWVPERLAWLDAELSRRTKR